MVTSNKVSDKKVVKMAEQNNGVVVPQRTLLGEVNEHITCPLCRGYYIDATTIVECLHSFCRSCIIKHLQVKSYCPVCEMMINSAKPNIKLDKALQDIVYKLVPGLFQKEMERRQTFYASRPGPAASATPEQRGEDTERIIFSPEDVISFSLEYADATDNDSISSKSSDSNELQQQTSGNARRYLQCPAVVNVSHLKKFLSMKFDIDSSQFAIDILYKRVPLPDYYTLMDIAYIYNWKRNEPMRFFYQIIDYVAIRNRLFDNNRKGSHFRDRKPSLASTEDTNAGSPAPNLDHVSEASSGTGSPMPDENSTKQNFDNSKKNDSVMNKSMHGSDNNLVAKTETSSKKNDDEVEKSQFLISFELTAKNTNVSPKTSPTKTSCSDSVSTGSESLLKSQATTPKDEDTLKRKHHATSNTNMPEMKKLKIELEKTVLPDLSNISNSGVSNPQLKTGDTSKSKLSESGQKLLYAKPPTHKATVSGPTKDVKQPATQDKQTILPENSIPKRPTAAPQNILSPKRKLNNEPNSSTTQAQPITQKTVSPLKLQLPKPETHLPTSRSTEIPKNVKKIPDLKPGVPTVQSSQNKGQTVSKVRMDLLANNSDPTIDRSKILSQVKTSLSLQSPPGQTSGDPLKSLFDSCKINIPSSLSITLTDQKQDPRIPAETITNDQKKNVINKNLSGANSTASHKAPSPPVHNYIEILKLPDTDPKKQNKVEGASETKTNNSNKTESIPTPPKACGKSSESSAKGPIPNLKPIADTKLGKQTANYSSPITFQQTFEQQLQTLQTDKKPTVKFPKNKAQVPKLVPATPKTFSVVSKLQNPNNKPNPTGAVTNPENKPSSALDLSNPGTQSQLSPHQTKAFETMQSIANLAKKQNLPLKAPLPALPQNFGSVLNRSAPPAAPMRLPSMANMSQIKQDKISTGGLASHTMRQEMPTKTNPVKYTNTSTPALSSPNPTVSSLGSPSTAQPSPRSTRSPSSSPKLVIAEDKQASSAETSINQSNQISSTNINSASKSESLKPSPGPSKIGVKPVKPLPPPAKITGIRHPITPTVKSNPSPADMQLYNVHHHALLRHQMQMNEWFKAQRQFMSNMAQAQNDFNKEKQ